MSVPVGTTVRVTERMAQRYGVNPQTSFEIVADDDPNEYLCGSDDPSLRGAWNKQDLEYHIEHGLLEIV